MNLKVLLPFQVFVDKTNVSRVVAQTLEKGEVGLLPHRLDPFRPPLTLARRLRWAAQGRAIFGVRWFAGLASAATVRVMTSPKSSMPEPMGRCSVDAK